MIPALLLGSLLSLSSFSPPQETGPEVAPADAPGLTALLLERKDDADPELVRRLANLETAEALQGLTRFYDSVASLYMRRIVLHGFVLFDDVPELQPAALQKLADIATQSFESELRETAIDALADCRGGRPLLQAIVASDADDTVRERALRHHVAGATPEDLEWYQRIYGSEETRKKKESHKEKDKGKEEPVYSAPLKELAFDGLAASRTTAQLVAATASTLVQVRRRALEELSARRDPDTAACAERLYEERKERPDVRLLAAQILLAERGPRYAERLFKDAKRSDVPLELAFGIADLLSALDDQGLKSQVTKGLGQGQAQEKRFHLRMAAQLPDPKIDKALLELSEDRDRLVVSDALRVMGQRGNPTFVPRLEELLKTSPDPLVLGAAIEALNRLQGSEARWRAEIARLANDSVEVVRNAALEALGRSRDAGQLPLLIGALAHPSWTTRLAAAHALEELHEPAGVGALCARIGQEEGRMVSEFEAILWRLTAQPFRADGAQWKRWWDAEGAGFRFPTAEEFQKRQRERELREARQVSHSFRGVKVDSRFFGLRIASHHVAFVVDVSGSMDWRLGGEKASEGPKRMDVARKELMACIEALEAGTYFNILPFSNDVMPWKDGTVECTEETFNEAKDFVAALVVLSGTNIYAGLKAAFQDPSVDTIFFLSDGEPSVGAVTDPGTLREEVRAWNAERGVVVHTISIGDRFPLLQWLAEDSGGQYRTYP